MRKPYFRAREREIFLASFFIKAYTLGTEQGGKETDMEQDNGLNVEAVEPVGQETEGGQSFDGLLRTSKAFQSEFDRRVSKALETAKAKWAEAQEQEKVEAARLSEIANRERQKEREELKQEWEKFHTERAQFESERMERAAEHLLSEQQIPTSFAHWLKADTTEETEARVKEFAKEYKESLNGLITERLKGSPPKGGGVVSPEQAIRRAAGLE